MSSVLSDPRHALRAASVLVGLVWLPVIVLSGPAVHDLTYDDAWYYFQIGRNIAEGAGSTFDGLHPTNGYHPLWMVVTAGAYSIGFDDLAAVRALLVLQLAMWVAALLLLAGSLAASVGKWPLLAGRSDAAAAGRRGTAFLAVAWFAIGANPYVLKLFVSGMEKGVAALLGVGLLVLSVRHRGDPLQRPVLVTALAALLFLARTDAAFLIASLFAWTALVRGNVDRRLVASAAAIGGTVVTYLASNIAIVGHPMQVSGVTKRVDPDASGWLTVAVLVALAGLVLLTARRAHGRESTSRVPRLRTWVLSTAWWPAGTLILLAYEWGFTTEIYLWHYAPQSLWVVATIGYAVADIYEGGTVERAADDPRAGRRSVAIGAVLALPFVAGGLLQVRTFTDPEIRSLQLGDRAAGEWVAANLAPDAVVGSFDAGVFGYFADRTVVNLDGLVNSFEWYDARREGTEATAAFLVASGLDHVANHGNLVDGDDPRIRASIDRLLGNDAGSQMRLVHTEAFVYRGNAGGTSGPRPYATFVWRLTLDATNSTE